MSTAALKRELAFLRSSLAALKPSQPATLSDPIAWAERTAGLTLDPWQRDELLSTAPRLLLNATRQSGKSTAAALKAAWTPESLPACRRAGARALGQDGALIGAERGDG
jgi:hypothetical protein